MLNIVDGEPSRRLKTKSTKSVIQAILDSLPPRLLLDIDETRREEIATGLESELTIKGLLERIAKAQSESCQRLFRRTLVLMDAQRYHRRWICPNCNQRWGRHDPSTLACPNLSPFSVGELE